jgi:hypothetical protein
LTSRALAATSGGTRAEDHFFVGSARGVHWYRSDEKDERP